MFFNEKKELELEQQIIKNDLSLQELLIRIDTLDREVKVLLDELKVTPEQITQFVSEKDNFTQENWNELQTQRKMLDEKLTLQLSNIRNPKKTSKTLSEKKHIAPHWIFVR